jgi:hypothetical protein
LISNSNSNDLENILNNSEILSEEEKDTENLYPEEEKKVFSSERYDPVIINTHKRKESKKKNKKTIIRNKSSPQLSKEEKNYAKDLNFNDAKLMEMIMKNTKKDCLLKIISRNNEFTYKLGLIQKKKYNVF